MSFAEKDAALFFNTYERLPIEISHGDGCYLFTANGNRYLDLFGGLAVNLLGYCRREVNEAIITQIQKYSHLSNLFLQSPQIDVASKLTTLAGYERVFLCNSGTEATEGAIKLARKWGAARGKQELVAFHGAFHGRSMGALSIMENKKYKEGYEPFLDHCTHVEFNDVVSLERALNEKTCAVFLEFIQGEGGIQIASTDFVKALFALKEKFGFLVVADEIQSGIGRTGRFFSFEHWNVTPDVVLCAKGLGGGLPLGAILGKESLAEIFGKGRHGTTFGGNPVACAAGSATLDVIIKKNVMQHAQDVGNYFLSHLRSLQEEFPTLIKEVRGMGCMIGVELTVPGKSLVQKCLDRGLLINCTQEYVLRFLPPLIITQDQIIEAITILRRVCQEVAPQFVQCDVCLT